MDHPPETIQYVFSVLFYVYCKDDPRYSLELKSPPLYYQSNGQFLKYLLLQVIDLDQKSYIFDLYSNGEWKIVQKHPFEDYFRKLVQQMERMLMAPSTLSENGVPIPVSCNVLSDVRLKNGIVKTRYKPLYGNPLKWRTPYPNPKSDRWCMVCGDQNTIIVYNDFDPENPNCRITEIFCDHCACYSTFWE